MFERVEFLIHFVHDSDLIKTNLYGKFFKIVLKQLFI